MGKARTKEELFILTLHEAAEVGDDVAITKLQDVTGFHDKSIKIICRNLAQANFIKKVGQTHVKLTSNGCTLAEQLMEE